MKSTISEDLISISTLLMTVHDRGEIITLANELNTIIKKTMEIERTKTCIVPQQKTKSLSAPIKFTKKEIEKMSKTFKKEFIANGLVAHVIKRESGKNGFYYEIRYRRNGYNLRAANKDLAVAKAQFIELTRHIETPEERINTRLKFGTVLQEWFQHTKGKIAPSTWKPRVSLAKRRIGQNLLNKNIKEVRTADIDEYMPDFDDSPRFYEDMRTIFNGTFKYAIASGITTHNPVTLIPFRRADRTSRVALTKKQIIVFLTNLREDRFSAIRQSAYVAYFFGLRPCEIDHETHFEGDFLIARNRKRKNGKIEYKKIPIPKQARGLIQFDKPIAPQMSYEKWLKYMEAALTNGLTPYNLRHTFATLCSKPTDIKPEIVDIWMGDSPQRLVGKHYVHYPDEFMQEKMNLVDFPIL